ncbi:hypothetical protein FACS1894176_07780 [Bacteroidia bacterium]|nr:hypothetical protein FACS1894176_07780 [Bacteroidia bacterium]
MKQKILVLGLLFFVAVAGMNAQVNIGSGGSPKDGAVLDLSQSSNSGLILPRVALDNATHYQLGGKTTADSYPAGAGTVVYNTGDVLAKGFYVWDGNNWLAVAGTVAPDNILKVGDNTYSIAKFGSAGTWMTENLREIPDTVSSPSITTNNNARNWNYAGGNSSSVYAHADSVAKYGLLYSWSAAINSTSGLTVDNPNNSSQARVRGICPKDWHLPSDYEWTQLEKEIAMSTAYSTGLVAGDTVSMARGTGVRGADAYNSNANSLDKKMKANQIWSTPGSSKSASEGGFSALPASYWGTAPGSLGSSNAYFWSSSSNSPTRAWHRSIDAGIAGVIRNNNYKYYQFSVRCKKD